MRFFSWIHVEYKNTHYYWHKRNTRNMGRSQNRKNSLVIAKKDKFGANIKKSLVRETRRTIYYIDLVTILISTGFSLFWQLKYPLTYSPDPRVFLVENLLHQHCREDQEIHPADRENQPSSSWPENIKETILTWQIWNLLVFLDNTVTHMSVSG